MRRALGVPKSAAGLARSPTRARALPQQPCARVPPADHGTPRLCPRRASQSPFAAGLGKMRVHHRRRGRWFANVRQRDRRMAASTDLRARHAPKSSQEHPAQVGTWSVWDLTAYGRPEFWEDSPEGWPQRWDSNGGQMRLDGRPTAQWSRLAAGHFDDLGTGATATAPTGAT